MMRYDVKVIAGSSRNCVKEENGRLKVFLTIPAQKGKANKALINLLSEYLKVKKGRIHIIKGCLSPLKIVEVC